MRWRRILTIDFVREQSGPSGAGLSGGHGLTRRVLLGWAEAQSRLRMVVLLPALWSEAEEIGFAKPPSRRVSAPAGQGLPPKESIGSQRRGGVVKSQHNADVAKVRLYYARGENQTSRKSCVSRLPMDSG